MAFPIHLLTTWAHCDAALASLTRELRELTLQDSVLGLREDQATASAASRAAELHTLADTIATLTPLVAGLPAGSAIRRTSETLLRRATRRQQNLSVIRPGPNPVPVFLQAVDLRQVAVQVPELQQAIAEVTAHRATLGS